MAADVAQIGQVEVAPVSQEHIAPQALGLRPVVVFGIGVGAQGNRDGGILKHIQRAVEFDGRRTHGVETARKHLGQSLVEGKRAPILKDKAVEFTEGLPGFKTQYFPRQLTHDVTQ